MMPDIPVRMSCKGAHQLKAVSRDLRGASKTLRKEMRANLKKAGAPVVADVKRAALGVDVTMTDPRGPGGEKSTGLRRAVSAATGMSVTTRGIRIQVSAKKLARTHPPSLAKYLDAAPFGRYRAWRHPVYGNKNVWVQQTGQPFFFTTIRRHAPKFRRSCIKAMEHTAAKIAKGQ